MKLRKILIYTAAVAILLGCSSKRNTGLSRGYQNFAAKYNLRHNAQTAFNEGTKSFRLATRDDFSHVIPLYPVVSQETTGGISSQMDVVIEKCRKTIKTRSIRVKPSKKPWGMSDADYRKFRTQEEFNPQVPRAWLMLGKAEYYKADFIDAVSDFNYLIRHYSEEEELVYEAKLWVVRAYTDMGWLVEAESYLGRIKESAVPYKLQGTYAAFTAHLLVTQKRYAEAIPYLRTAIEKEADKYDRTRFNFALAQIYELQGNKTLAQQHYKAAESSAFDYGMIFNSNLKAAQLEKNKTKAIKNLQKMAKSANNKDYLDQVYFAIGDEYWDLGQKPKAIEAYKTAMAKSTRGGVEKALAALKVAEYYYDEKEYIQSATYYDSVVMTMPNTHEHYREAEKRSQILGELAQNHNIVELQDSLLRLAEMSEAEQLKIIAGVIAELKAKEEQAAKDSANRAALEVAKQNDRSDYMNPSAGTAFGSQEWYFYSQNSINQGKTEFRKRWGNRQLEDNWRRATKLISNPAQPEESEAQASADTTASDSLANDPHSPEFYLAQIPKTQEERDEAQGQIATALYNMGGIFHTKLEDFPSADETYREFYRRFPADERLAEVYFAEYQINGKMEKPTEQDFFREKLIAEFPESKFAVMLSTPDYYGKMQRMLRSQDSLYLATYNAYKSGSTNVVRENYAFMEKEYPLSELMPKFAMLNALAIAKQGDAPLFEQQLDSLVNKYPDSEVAPLGKNILALIRQGREQSAKPAATDKDLSQRRSEEAEKTVKETLKATEQFTLNMAEPQTIILLQKTPNTLLFNNMLYDLAAYNFSKFMVKDFDLDTRKIDKSQVIMISGFETFEEGEWYKALLLSDEEFVGKSYIEEFEIFMVSDSNLGQISTVENLRNYQKFLQESKNKSQRKGK